MNSIYYQGWPSKEYFTVLSFWHIFSTAYETSNSKFKNWINKNPWGSYSSLSTKRSLIRSITKGFETDTVIITAASSDNRPLLMAGEILRDRGVVVIVGGTNIDIPRSPFYHKENEIKVSRSYRADRYNFNYEVMGLPDHYIPVFFLTAIS